MQIKVKSWHIISEIVSQKSLKDWVLEFTHTINVLTDRCWSGKMAVNRGTISMDVDVERGNCTESYSSTLVTHFPSLHNASFCRSAWMYQVMQLTQKYTYMKVNNFIYLVTKLWIYCTTRCLWPWNGFWIEHLDFFGWVFGKQ